MFRTFARRFLPNPFDRILKRAARKNAKRILIGWNRGLGDIALGLYAAVHRIGEFIPDAEITFATRENLRDGFSLLEGVKTIVIPGAKRGEPLKIDSGLKDQFDLVIETLSPTDWLSWQHGKVTPRLKWDPKHDALYEKFGLEKNSIYIGVQAITETDYGLWRNWPQKRWQELFQRLEKIRGVKVLLFGYGDEPKFKGGNIVDLRGKTSLFELLSVIKHCCYGLVMPDSGISSMTYYLDENFPLRFVSLWANRDHGILKQAVPSPNCELIHLPLIAGEKDLSLITVDAVLGELFPVTRTGVILLAAGQGTRLGVKGPKGLFVVEGKTLFQWFCEKVPKGVPLAIMTSTLNHEETVAYFEKNDFFGLDVHFFQQEMEPFLDDEKRPLAMRGPKGNGNVFRSFVQAGLADVFEKRGIDLVTVSYIENPLAKPIDPGLIYQARKEEADATVQCIERLKSDEKMGALVEKGDKIEIIEYTELNPDQEYKYAYSGQIAFALPFFRKMAQKELPLHWVRKKMEDRWIWKGEQFIFDAFPFASRVRAFEVPRETHYAPVKDLESLKKVQERLRETV